jgi:hypothetical protein
MDIRHKVEMPLLKAAAINLEPQIRNEKPRGS